MNIIQALEAFGRSTGEYWSQDNAAFEQGNPSLLARAARSVNPMSGFGSALGAMHDAAGAGFPAKDTAIALMQAAPAFGAVITKAGSVATGAAKAIPTITANDYLKSLSAIALNTATSVAADEAQASEHKTSNQSKK